MNSKKLICIISVLLSSLTSFTTHATNGLFQHGYGVRVNAMAGAGVALPLDALTSATNPAGTVFVGERKDVGLALFSPERSYKVTGAPSGGFPPFPGSEVDSGDTLFLIPNFGWSREIDAKSSVGVSLYGNGGMNTNWSASDTPIVPTPRGPASGTFLGGDAGVDYSQLFINLNYARKISNKASLGISGIINYSELELEGVGAFSDFSTNPGKLSNTGKSSDTGLGIKVGGQFALASNVDVGVSYQSEIKNTLDEYAGLFANGGELNIPATATIGLAFKPNNSSTVVFDIQHIFYSDSDAIGNVATGNPGGGLFACAGGNTANCFGGAQGAGFGWEDMTVFKLGYQVQTSSDMVWRFGVSYGEQPIPEGEVTLNIIAPGVIETHLTAGFSKKLASGNEFSAALMYAPENCVEGPSAFNPGQTIELCMHQVQLELGLSF